jgi:hypothetical protein
MLRSDQPSLPSARICCCLVSSKTLLMPATELAFRPDVNVSIVTGNGRFSAVDPWPVLGVHRGSQQPLSYSCCINVLADHAKISSWSSVFAFFEAL